MSLLLEKFAIFLILILTIILPSNNLIMAQTNNAAICHSSANPCIKINDLLKPSGETLPMPPKLNDTDTIQNVSYFVGNSDEAKCWCNKEFYDLLLNCTTCLSSPTVNATVSPLDDYKNDCKKYGTEFKEPKQSSSLTKTPSEASGARGPNKLLIALGVSALVTLLASLAFCLCVIRRKKIKSRAYAKLKSDYYASKGRGINISGRNVVNENDEKELYSPSVPMPPPLAHQPQQNEQQQQQQQKQQQQSMDQNQHNSYNFNNAIYGEQQYYVEANQAQVPRSSHEYSDNANNNHQNYPK
ncbi:hypothetical protein RhiirA4_396981 [Rhizophagus irregularis]|uniref:Mid2 domain-containing protein n=1 Tax=Rhizophagus irregularis TaxID=588596 RepID=A0A2I1G6B0_9GLOM|nr:hypothetical protein RhiirA4_396981 [Rhizophagus irregularis]